MKPPVFLLLVILAAFTAVAQPSSGEAILGKAGNTYITEDEFVRRFEMTPGLYRSQGGKLDEEKLMVFYSIVAEKLLAQEAVDRGLNGDSLFLASLADMEKALSRDELYRQEVAGKAHVSDAEIQEGMRRARRELFVTYLYSDSAREAAFLRARISNAADFNRLQVDTSMDIVRDTATIIWGDADAVIEDAAYRLRVGETSPVVKADKGYYILHLTRERPSGYYSSMQPNVLRERVAQRLEQRKEKLRLNRYMAGILNGKTGYARPGPFRDLANALQASYGLHTDQSSITLNDTLLAEVRAHLGRSLKDTLVVAGNTAWSIARVLERLSANGFALTPAELQELPVRLNRQFEIWVWQELLSQEALRRGMNEHPQVKKDIEEWRQSFLAQFMRSYVARSVTVSDDEVMSYLKRQGDSVQVPLVQIQELRTNTPVEMQEAMRDLEQKVPFEEVIRRWSNDAGTKLRKGLSDFFPITDRSPVGKIAGEMNVGEFYGPLAVPGGTLYFKLVAKKDSALTRDTSAVARMNAAREQVRALKTKRTLNLLLAQSGRQRGFTVYEDRLKAIQVSAVPMMTFRILGFGGRIWGVPMLEKQIEWLTVEPPAGKVVP